MPAKLLLLVLLSVCCSSVAQILLRTGMSRPPVSEAMSAGSLPFAMMQIAGSPWVLGGLALYFGGALVWLFVLARTQASLAYPFVGIGFILTLILGVVLLHESLTAQKASGTLLVSLGAFLIAMSRS